ncbi:MarR family transcriptional regulator [Natrinema sp. SYSU A 869]|uniref:MarR family transcriptional regulator n=1 Tax=Natrinema sp. SYSU A 869 TaxID=2871694 RepID=UPI001CA420EA|nr:MarR family transcriptional regulator [Natrinema sp. SYSU A 869]
MTSCSRQTALAVLVTHGPLEIASLAAHCEAHPLTVAQRCAALQSTGDVRQTTGGVYEITAAGETRLAELAEPTLPSEPAATRPTISRERYVPCDISGTVDEE